MDRRYICTGCGVKWFIPDAQPHRPDLTTCPACGEQVDRLAPQDERIFEPPDEASAGVGGG